MFKTIAIFAITGLAIFSLVSCSREGQSKSAQNKTEEANVIDVNNQYCPVTSEKIKDELATSYVYEGKRYRFCCASCIIPFKRDPQKYIQKIEREEKAHPNAGEHMHD
ncbi:MAG: YHS domain-containing protein [Candidatus Omnitrophota bacterium]|nr:YHS domain-containing protein [Candidatus Omnitrophota bacterium]